MATINAGQLAGNFVDTAAFQGQKISVSNLLTTENGDRYWTGLVDEGGAIPLADGVFANLIPSGSGLQPGDNVSELTNDAGYITSSEVAKVSFQTDGITRRRIASGQSGELERKNAVTDKVYKLKLLVASGLTGGQTGITLEINGVNIESEVSLDDGVPAATGVLSTSFAIIQDQSLSDAALSAGIYSTIECSSFAIIKNAGNTVKDIDLAYEIGEYK